MASCSQEASMKFETVRSSKVFKGRAIKVWVDEVRYPDGREVRIEVIHHPGAVTILPIDEEGFIWFVRQYRHPAGQLLLELPAGTLEPGEPPKITAAREIREEIGMRAEKLTLLGSFFVAPGYSDEYMHTYLAEGLSHDPLELDAGEFLNVEKYSIKETYAIFDRGEIIDAKTIAVLAIARQRLES
jgi:ADP-ribose pyrophosphatase